MMPRFAPGSHGEGRFAIRAARFVSEADFPRGEVGEQPAPEGRKGSRTPAREDASNDSGDPNGRANQKIPPRGCS